LTAATKYFHLTPVLLFLLALLVPAFAQTPDSTEWQTMRPEGEEFTILMPKDTVVEAGKMPYHRMELNTRLYLVNPTNGPVLGVVSMSGIKSNPALYSELERMNSYVDAFKRFFVARVAPKETKVKLTFLNAKTLNGHTGREYQMAIGNRSGTAHVFSTRRRFYAVVFLTNAKAESLSDQFLSSFQLPTYIPPARTTVVASQPPKTEAAGDEDKPANKTANNEGLNEQQHSDQKPADSSAGDSKTKTASGDTKTKNPETNGPDAAQGQKKPISGGILNGKALSLPKPDYPEIARAAKAGGAVSVKVMIDEYGTVISAEAASGHPLLQQAAVVAAYQARFSQTLLMGEPVKVTGVIVYNFTPQ